MLVDRPAHLPSIRIAIACVAIIRTSKTIGRDVRTEINGHDASKKGLVYNQG